MSANGVDAIRAMSRDDWDNVNSSYLRIQGLLEGAFTPELRGRYRLSIGHIVPFFIQRDRTDFRHHSFYALGRTRALDNSPSSLLECYPALREAFDAYKARIPARKLKEFIKLGFEALRAPAVSNALDSNVGLDPGAYLMAWPYTDPDSTTGKVLRGEYDLWDGYEARAVGPHGDFLPVADYLDNLDDPDRPLNEDSFVILVLEKLAGFHRGVCRAAEPGIDPGVSALAKEALFEEFVESVFGVIRSFGQPRAIAAWFRPQRWTRPFLNPPEPAQFEDCLKEETRHLSAILRSATHLLEELLSKRFLEILLEALLPNQDPRSGLKDAFRWIWSVDDAECLFVAADTRAHSHTPTPTPASAFFPTDARELFSWQDGLHFRASFLELPGNEFKPGGRGIEITFRDQGGLSLTNLFRCSGVRLLLGSQCPCKDDSRGLRRSLDLLDLALGRTLNTARQAEAVVRERSQNETLVRVIQNFGHDGKRPLQAIEGWLTGELASRCDARVEIAAQMTSSAIVRMEAYSALGISEHSDDVRETRLRSDADAARLNPTFPNSMTVADLWKNECALAVLRLLAVEVPSQYPEIRERLFPTADTDPSAYWQSTQLLWKLFLPPNALSPDLSQVWPRSESDLRDAADALAALPSPFRVHVTASSDELYHLRLPHLFKKVRSALSISLGFIFAEILTNTMKHTFPRVLQLRAADISTVTWTLYLSAPSAGYVSLDLGLRPGDRLEDLDTVSFPRGKSTTGLSTMALVLQSLLVNTKPLLRSIPTDSNQSGDFLFFNVVDGENRWSLGHFRREFFV